MVQRRMDAVPLLLTRSHSGIIASSGFHSQQAQCCEDEVRSSFKYMLHDNLLSDLITALTTLHQIQEMKLSYSIRFRHRDQESAGKHTIF